ncbi:flagellar basal body-associated protein FliL [Parasedimentitalea huanghaiensis]|uniref:Flagellar basal body-associated protein FliL n=1 Tax=Parasedimentitalea huanghaiensis TaxID=2682100 RepID=A0A6L6WLL9_9RHOB|nr:flagellar basal body-associated protein FliL [Zongyanglinia huanghaiensis]MVO17899.1 flagellar basal body-associated protein FliL [Zongyanglinia huanghaiensis]
MLSKLLPIILLLVGTGGGIGAGVMLAPPAEIEASGEMEDGHAVATIEESHGEEGEPEHVYVKLANQFVVPVVERDELSALVVLSLSLETSQEMSDRVYALEPKLRDVFLQVLFDHANMGGFRGAFTRSDVMMPLRTALREAAQHELGRGVSDVLIMDISRQDV